MVISNHLIADEIKESCENDTTLNDLIANCTGGKKLWYYIGLNLDDHDKFDIELFDPDTDSRSFSSKQKQDFRASLLIDTIGRKENGDKNEYQISLQVTIAHERELTDGSDTIEFGANFIRYKGISHVEDVCIQICKLVDKLNIPCVAIEDVDYETAPLGSVSNISMYRGFIMCSFSKRKGFNCD